MGSPFWGLISSDTSKLAKAGKQDAASLPDVRWRRGGRPGGGGHVVRSSARASLSDLYGSSGRTGAAKRETGRVSSRAHSYRRCHTTRRPARFQIYGAFVLCSPPAEVYGISPKGAGELVASGLPGCDLVSYRGCRSGCPPLREAPRAFARTESLPEAGCRTRGGGGGPGRPARPPPSPHRGLGAGRAAGGAPRRRGGSVAGTVRSFWRASGGEWERDSLPQGAS